MSMNDNMEDDLQYMHEQARHRPSSIDLSLELERQLDIDSIPNTPDVAQTRMSSERPQSLDPHVLASIVTQLRLSLAEVTRERDSLSQALTEAEEREANLKDALHTVSERCLRIEEELTAVTEQRKEDTDAVTMLRGKLEDSRRALMRLQTENRRATMTLDLSRAGPSGLQGPPSSRRSSFVPAVGSPGNPTRMGAHRRISSVSEPGASFRNELASPPLGSGRLEPLQLVGGAPSQPDRSSRRMSGFFGRVTPSDLPPTADASEVEELRKELQAVKESLEETRHELSEVREAQEASETCANALRTFISDNSIGMHPAGRGAVVPPPQSSGPDHSRKNTNSSWGFKLWTSTPTATNSPTASPAVASPPALMPLNGVPPLTKKFGGFFSSRSSISSTSSGNRLEPPLHQESMFNGSDSSSVVSAAEPVSPASELPPASVMVQSFDDVSSQLSLTASPEPTRKSLQGHVHEEEQLDASA